MCHNRTEKSLLGSLGSALGTSLIIFSLVSCSTLPNTSPFSPVFVTDRAQFTLLPASEIEKPVDGAQQLTGTFGSQNFVLEAWVRADESGIDMDFYNSFGAGMGSFSFNDKAVSLDSPVFPQNLKPEYLAADFQFCFYKPQALQRVLKAAGLVFEISDGTFTETRRILAGKETVIEIKKNENQIHYANLLRGYSYVLEGTF